VNKMDIVSVFYCIDLAIVCARNFMIQYKCAQKMVQIGKYGHLVGRYFLIKRETDMVFISYRNELHVKYFVRWI
jgi:hypothetical protein